MQKSAVILQLSAQFLCKSSFSLHVSYWECSNDPYMLTIELWNCTTYLVLLIRFDTDPTIHDIMLGTQFLSAFVVSSSASASFTLATIFTCHVVGQLNIMVIWVNEFVDRLQKENKDNHINKISVIVEHHLRILR